MENSISANASGFVIQPRLQFKNIKDKLIYQLLVDEANFVASNRCEIGQTIVVLTNLSKETGWSRDVIRGSLDRLEKLNFINTETLPQKRGILITVCHYKDFQSLGFYQKNEPKIPQENPHEEPQEVPQENPQGDSLENHCESKGEGTMKKQNPQEEPQENPHEEPQEIPHTITAFNNSINNSIKTYKNLRHILKSDLPQISSIDDTEVFVNAVTAIDGFPEVNFSLITRYIEMIRMTRSTCKLSTNLMLNHLEKTAKYDVDVIHYAFLSHIIHHEDKRENYTLGIMRNTNVHEARRKLIKIKNKHSEEAIVSESNRGSADEQYELGF